MYPGLLYRLWSMACRRLWSMTALLSQYYASYQTACCQNQPSSLFCIRLSQS